jgi:Flp pilus assembly protein TadD
MRFALVHSRPTLTLLTTLCLAIGSLMLSGCASNPVVLREQGRIALARGNHQTALKKYEKLVEMRPTNAQYQYGLGASALAAGQAQRAELALERAWELAPQDREWTPKILDKLAQALYEQDDINQLNAFLNETIKQYGNTASYLRKAEFLTKAGDLDGARVAYRKAAYFADENNAQPYVEMASFYESINDRENAVKSLRYAHHIAPANQAVVRRLKDYGVQPGQGEQPPKPALLGN